MKKIISYIFIVLVMIGVFTPLVPVSAQTAPQGGCSTVDARTSPRKIVMYFNKTYDECKDLKPAGVASSFNWTENTVPACTANNANAPCTGADGKVVGAAGTILPTDGTVVSGSGAENTIEQAVKNTACASIVSGTIIGCIVNAAYAIFYVLPAFLLATVATLFNALLSFTMGSGLYNSAFISQAWQVVRDLSNILFIVVLLYIALQMILDIGGHHTKQMIGSVVLMALLINFSMFFTKVVIDSSNILALVFYNKIIVETPGKAPRPYEATFNGDKTGVPEKDIGGAIVSGFNPAGTMNPSLFQKTITVNGIPQQQNANSYLLLGIIMISSVIFLFAAYAFFISGFAFLGRMIELWILIIFSPFAFMSFIAPDLKGVEGIGWSAWTKSLVKTSFMAPIFMFFLYLISKIVQTDFITELASTSASQGLLASLILIVIPAMISLILLMKATEYAKKGSGQLGDAVIGFGKMAAGFVVGGGLGFAATAGQGLVGKRALNMANNDDLKQRALRGDRFAKAQLSIANSLANKSFDFRQTGLGKQAAKSTGIKLDTSALKLVGLDTHALEGGAVGQVKHEVEHEEKEKKKYQLSTADALAADNLANNSARRLEYLADQKAAKAFTSKMGVEFNEAKFREAYEAGRGLQGFGLDKTPTEGIVPKTSKEINKERSDAYINRSEASHPHELGDQVTQTALKALRSTPTSAAGMAAIATGALIAGPLGAGAAYLGASFLRGIQQSLKIHGNAPEVIAELRKGPDAKKEGLKQIQEMLAADKKGASGAHKEEEGDTHTAHAAPVSTGTTTKAHDDHHAHK